MERAKDERRDTVGKPAADLIAGIVGPLFYRRWFSKEAIDDRFTEATIDVAIKLLFAKNMDSQLISSCNYLISW